MHASAEINFGGSFGASTDYHHIEDSTEEGQNFFTQAEASCCVYIGEVFEYVYPPFHRNFLGGLSTLTDEYDEAVYRRFIKTFGTHYVTHANMGSMYGQQSEITYENWSKMISDGLDIGAYAKFGALGSANFSLG